MNRPEDSISIAFAYRYPELREKTMMPITPDLSRWGNPEDLLQRIKQVTDEQVQDFRTKLEQRFENIFPYGI